ncbi:hypothetical protein QYE76_069862 [Lolium multiflorum]|uniref:Integrase catalytic domain-containing protein n=1 Tax=Lolium multiflorum TaxID=4521 RepID=A0AAD8SH68_LOLMU|nr:hypothetical protein QYE76_069862 [Lolium multiflorum]
MEKKIGITDQGGALMDSATLRVQRLRNLEEAEARTVHVEKSPARSGRENSANIGDEGAPAKEKIPGLDRSIIEHRLPLKKGFRPFQQRARQMKAEVLEEVKKEIKKMLDAGFIRPCRYAEWISNVVPVEKKDGRWRVAIDFRNLNSATPKDEYPMPVAETLINAAAGHKILSFMDGNAGYNQIFMAPEDIHKTAFRVPGSVGLFEYVVMTFGLKNAGATYQRAMNYIFHDLIGKLVEIYIDDVVVKSVATDGHLEDLRQVLDRTRKFGLRMNPKKCAFGVTAGQFLGFLVHERGIEIGLKSQEAVRTMKPPTTKKELQCLIGKINFVRRFISNLSGRIEPFMGLVKIKPDEEFRWGAEQQQAFDDIKEYLTKPPVLVPPRQDRPFYIYLSVADTSIASVVVQVYDGLEKVVFYLSRRMLDAETRFGIPQTITTDGGSVFVSKEMKEFCDDMGIKLIRSSPYYAQANGQAEASNKSLIKLIKRKIDEHPKRWHEVLSEALWAYRMSCHGAIKTTPYQLVYGQEAVLPWEVKAGSRRVTFQNDLTAEEYAALISDSIEDATELRLWSLEKIKENKAKVARAYNKKVKPKEFQVDDLVWEAVLPLGTRDKEYGKWSPNWHGPYKVVQVLKGNAYMLEMLDGVKFPVAVNGQHLKKYFPKLIVAGLIVSAGAAVDAASGDFLVAATQVFSWSLFFLVIIIILTVRPSAERFVGGYPAEEEESSSSSSSPSSSSSSSSLSAHMRERFVGGCLAEEGASSFFTCSSFLLEEMGFAPEWGSSSFFGEARRERPEEVEEEEDIAAVEEGFWCWWAEQSKGMKWRTVWHR